MDLLDTELFANGSSGPADHSAILTRFRNFNVKNVKMVTTNAHRRMDDEKRMTKQRFN